MKLSRIGYLLAATGAVIVSSSIVAVSQDGISISRRDADAQLMEALPVASEAHELEKRKGGGGSSGGGGGSSGGGGGGGGGGGRSGGSGSTSSGSGSGSGSGSSSGGSGSRTGSGSGSGSGSGGGGRSVGPSYGGGRYYGGGATSSYKSGGRSPGGILPFAIGAGLLGAALIFPGLWLYGAYEYNYNHPYSFRNRTRNNLNETLPVTCLCEQYSACGCDDANNSTFLDGIIGDGNLANLNKSLVNVGNVNGTKTIVLNGTLPNDTVADASTNTGSASASASAATATAASAANKRLLLETSGFWLLGAIAGATVWLL